MNGRSRSRGTSPWAPTRGPSSSSATRASASSRSSSSACGAPRTGRKPPRRRSCRPSRTRRCTCAAAASPTNWAHAPWRCWRPSAASTAHRRCCGGCGGCWATTGPVNRCCRRGSSRSSRRATRTTAPCCRRRSPTRTRRSARSRRCWASCSAWRAWRCRWAATGPSWSWPSRSRIRRSPPRWRCCGRLRCTSGSSPVRSCGRGATACWATPWWCPPIRAT